MPTANRRRFVLPSIRLFLEQDYVNKELVIVDDGDDCIEEVVPRDQRIRYIRQSCGSLGAKRNVACEEARGEIILHWDDDDWYAPWRMTYQIDSLLSGDFDLCGIACMFFVDPVSQVAWEYVFSGSSPSWVGGASFCYWKSFWQNRRFANVTRGEDARFLLRTRIKLKVLPNHKFFAGRVHDRNTCKRAVARYPKVSLERLCAALGDGCLRYFSETTDPVSAALKNAPSGHLDP